MHLMCISSQLCDAMRHVLVCCHVRKETPQRSRSGVQHACTVQCLDTYTRLENGHLMSDNSCLIHAFVSYCDGVFSMPLGPVR